MAGREFRIVGTSLPGAGVGAHGFLIGYACTPALMLWEFLSSAERANLATVVEQVAGLDNALGAR